jgi:hypothetical protein
MARGVGAAQDMTHTDTPGGAPERDAAYYDLTIEGAIAASDAASFMVDDDPGCGGCENGEHCGACPCCGEEAGHGA